MVHVKHRPGLFGRIVDLLHSQKFWMDQIADEFQITPQMTKALFEIPKLGSITMKELAGELWCDASNATGIVDRLEARGFVERRPAEHDRRLKCVVLTVAGRRLRRRLDERMRQLPPALSALSAADQRTMAEILERALDNAHRQRAEREAGR